MLCQCGRDDTKLMHDCIEEMNVLPNFLIIGAMKSGTTSVYGHLKEHPDVFMPAHKEPEFFSDETVWKKGVSWYESLFNGRSTEKAVGEASTGYAKYPAFPYAAERIAKLLPDVKLIYVIRSPIERIYSHYVHNYYAGREMRNLNEAVLEDEHYIQVSRYYMQIEHYLKYFPRENLKVVILDDLKTEPLAVMQDIYQFLGVDSSFIPKTINEKKHQSKNKQGRENSLMKKIKKLPFYHSISSRLSEQTKSWLNPFLRKYVQVPEKLSGETRERLVEKLKQDVEQLSEYLVRDLTVWLQSKK
jgi:hypothetical protein